MKPLKQAIAIALLLIIFVFAVQNAALIEYQFLTWTFEARRSAVVAVCVAIGVLIGWVARGARQGRR